MYETQQDNERYLGQFIEDYDFTIDDILRDLPGEE